MGAPGSPTSAAGRPRGQHFLRSRSLAAQIVRSAGVDPGHLVLEIGAGKGVLTTELALRAREVWAVEVDPGLVQRLRTRFADAPHVRVVEEDVLSVPLPRMSFRVVSSIPFGLTARILHRLLDDPALPLLRADLVVQAGVARKRAAGGNLLAAAWGPWYTFTVLRRLPASCFRPPPAVDAALLAVERRREPLLDPDDRAAYLTLLRAAFTPRCGPLRRELRGLMPASGLLRLGIDADARAVDLTVDRWVELYRALDARRG